MRSDLQVFLQILPFTGQQPFNNQENGAAGGGRARALYSFASTCDEELSLRVLMWFHLTWVNNKFLITCKTTFPLLLQVGDIVTNLESIDDEWFLGDLRGKRALVPKLRASTGLKPHGLLLGAKHSWMTWSSSDLFTAAEAWTDFKLNAVFYLQVIQL